MDSRIREDFGMGDGRCGGGPASARTRGGGDGRERWGRNSDGREGMQ